MSTRVCAVLRDAGARHRRRGLVWLRSRRRAAARWTRGGAHWWIDGNGPHHTFSCNGYNVQRAIAVPSHRLVVVRLGVSPDNEEEQGVHCRAQIGRIVTELCAHARV